MTDERVEYEVRDRVAIIRMTPPEKLNALDESAIQGLRRAWLRFNDSDQRCAVLTSSGERAFSVGADIKDRDDLLAVRDSEDGAEGRVAFREKRKPQFTGR